jgi:hypothetical protein
MAITHDIDSQRRRLEELKNRLISFVFILKEAMNWAEYQLWMLGISFSPDELNDQPQVSWLLARIEASKGAISQWQHEIECLEDIICASQAPDCGSRTRLHFRFLCSASFQRCEKHVCDQSKCTVMTKFISRV